MNFDPFTAATDRLLGERMAHVIENDWITKAGLRAVVLFCDDSHRCGYVGIPKTHKLYGIDYDNAKREDGGYFDVHGGLTYAEGGETYPVENKDTWWFGFDCAHSGDATKYFSAPGDVMRSQSYVEMHCESLAEQLQAVKERV